MTFGGAAYAVALALAAVFVVAATSKLRAPEIVRRDFEAMGLRNPSLMARVVPALELVIAVSLVVAPSVGASLATTALVAMTVVLVRLLRAGTTAYCACFGSASTARPLTWRAVARNVALVAAAVVALYAEGPFGP